MARKDENRAFVCEQCGQEVLPVTNGGYRNHCPACLYSKHVDVQPGDRRAGCHGLMKPTGLLYKPGKGYQIRHVCLRCGAQRLNIVAEKTVQPDDIEQLTRLAPEATP